MKKNAQRIFFSRDLERRLRGLTQLCQPLLPIATGLRPKLQPGATVRAVLFDVYGTLLISKFGDVGTSLTTPTTGAVLEASPLLTWLNQHHPVENLISQQIQEQHGLAHRVGIKYPEVDILNIWENILARYLPPEQQTIWPLNRDTVAMIAMEYELLVNQVALMPGAISTLQVLRAAGLELGIVSNAQFYTPYSLEGLAGLTLAEIGFDVSLASWSFELGIGKPNPQLFALPLAKLEQRGILPEQVLFVGNDLQKDMQPAQQLGMQTALFVGDRRSLRLYQHDQIQAKPRPDYRLTSLAQLGEIVSTP